MALEQGTSLIKIRKNEDILSRFGRLYAAVPIILAYILIVLFFNFNMALSLFAYFLVPFTLFTWLSGLWLFKCPCCQKSVATLAGKKTYPFCPHCECRVFADQDFEEKIKQEMRQVKTVLPNLPDQQEQSAVSWKPIDIPAEIIPYCWEKNGLKMEKSGKQLAFKQPKMFWAYAIGLIAIIGIDLTIIVRSVISGNPLEGGSIAILSISIFFLLFLMIALLKLETKIFDKETGFYHEESAFYTEEEQEEYLKTIALENINMIQILSEYIGMTTIYRLNLVMENGHREICISSYSKQDITKQAKRLASFLGVALIYSLDSEVGEALLEKS